LCIKVVSSYTDNQDPHDSTFFDQFLRGHDKHTITNEFQLLQNSTISLDASSVSGKIASITSVSPTIIKSGDIITVTYYSNNPSIYDWIGAYSPIVNSSTINKTFPVKFGYCYNLDSPGYYTNGTGTGVLYFNMTNLRADIQFYYFHGNNNTMPNYNGRFDTAADYVLLNSSSTTVTFKDMNQPLRQRITATGNYDQFVLSWSSFNSTKPMMKWGLVSGIYNLVEATTLTISPNQLCGFPANSSGWRDLGLIHSATITGVSDYPKGTKIYYIFGDNATDNFSDEFIFNTPARPGDHSTDTVLILYDDLGRGFPSPDNTYTWSNYGYPSINTAMRVAAEVQAGGVDAIYHGGDISYAVGFEAVWDFFLDMISPMAGSVLYFTTVGNHESDWPNSASYFQTYDSGGECGVVATTVLPQPYPAQLNAPWWSYNVGMVHMVGMSTEHSFLIGSEQYNWLANDLKNVDRAVTPWVIFGGHRAMYINSNNQGATNADIDVMNLMIENIEPLLYAYNVNLAFYGHNHVVQRQSAVLNKTVIQYAEMVDGVAVHDNPQATVHMVVGTGGADFTFNNVFPPPDWNELVLHEWGYARVTVSGPSMLLWQWINNTNGEVLDTMTISQAYPIQKWTTNSTTPASTSHLILIAIIVVTILVVAAIAIIGYFYYSHHQKHPQLYESLLNQKEFEKISSPDEESSLNPI
jgi:hypothetical protein